MGNERNMLGNRSASATAVRTSAIAAGIGVVLMLIGAASQTFGFMIIGGIVLGIGVIIGLVGVIMNGMRR